MGTTIKVTSSTGIRQKDVLVCVFQRGGADGLSTVVPHGDPNYYLKRLRTAVPRPGNVGGVIDIDGFYGLHPAMKKLLPAFNAGRLAFVHATGLPHSSRSHFSGQAFVEAGVTSTAAINGGWLGRHLASTATSSDSPLRAISVGASVSAALQGGAGPLAMDGIAGFGLGSLQQTPYADTLSALYQGDPRYAGLSEVAFSAMDELKLANPSRYPVSNGAVYPDSSLGTRMAQAAKLIKANAGVDVICIDSEGWDLHINLPAYMPSLLSDLSSALSAFDMDLGARMNDVTVLVMTEFGRRVADNSSSGVDHGTAACLYALGGGVRGGRVYGTWPGLLATTMANGEDLAITTDLREILVQCAARRLGDSTAAALFPGFQPAIAPDLFAQR